MSEQKYLILDYETRSRADLKKVGGYEYARHRSTQILCVAWRLGTRETLSGVRTQIWSPAIPSPYGEFARSLLDPSVNLVAHNSFFEQVVTRFVLSKLIRRPGMDAIPVERWTCTAALAAALALPRGLGDACEVLKLPVQKDKEGHQLMLKMSKPRKATKKSDAKWHQKKSDLLRLMEYCRTDVDAEVELFLRMPPLSASEREVWEFDQRLNWRGFRVDRPLIADTLTMIGQEVRALDAETKELTGVHSTTKRARILDWVNAALAESEALPNLKAETVVGALQKPDLHPIIRRVLEMRQAVSKTSTAKYAALRAYSESDGRCHGTLIYHQASTGRWAGAGPQPQNFPKGTVKDTPSVVEDFAGGLDWVRLLYGNPMEVFSSCLRSMIIPSEGKEFVSADYATIEVRVLFWLAGHVDGLRGFRDREDIYRGMAGRIFGRDPGEIANPSSERDLGKSAVLGCGFGMGKKKFHATCLGKGQVVTENLAARAVSAYREMHRPVVEFWDAVEKAAIKAVIHARKNPREQAAFQAGRTTWWVSGGFLWCQLPSGRKLAYYQPEIRFEETPWGEPRAKLYHGAVDLKVKGKGKVKWSVQGTYGGKLVENCVQACARDLMAEALLRLDKSGYDVILSIHDEILAEQPKGWLPLEEFEEVMSEVPDWADGCPVEAKGWIGQRYRK